MRITQNLDPRAVIELEAKTIDDAIVALVEAAHRVYDLREPVENLIQVVQARGHLASTSLGGGVAIPHAQFAQLEREIVLVGRSTAGIDFRAIDEQPVHVLFLLLGPRNVKQHLAVLAALARICKTDHFLSKALAQESTSELYDWLAAIDV